MAEPAFSEVEPDPLDRIEFGAVGRQVDQGQVRRHAQAFTDVPAGPIEDQHGVGPGRHGRGELGQEEVHGCGRDLGQDQGHAGVACRADGTEQVGRREAVLVQPARPGAFLVPDVGDAALLADPGLIHEPELDPLGLGMPRCCFLHQAGQGFLNRACATGSTSGWTGRAFCQERSRLLSSLSMPFSA